MTEPFWNHAEQCLRAALIALAKAEGMDESDQSLSELLSMGQDELVMKGLDDGVDWSHMSRQMFDCIAAGLRSKLAV